MLFCTPFNFRIYCLLPNYCRFSGQGLKSQLNGFSELEIDAIEDKKRF
jgi:hypothetical protein